jgi:hypothetical protein
MDTELGQELQAEVAHAWITLLALKVASKPAKGTVTAVV